MKPRTRPCRHLFTDGHQCGSPALRGEELCFYHHSTRRPIKQQVLHGRTRATLPEPLDLHAIQRGLAELLRLTAAEAIALPLAAQLHRQLTSASQNLARIDRGEARAQARADALNLHRAPVTDYTNHPTLGTIAPAPETAEAAPEALEAPVQVHTQLQSNQDFSTSQKSAAEILHAPISEPTLKLTEDPLPDPVARFTLPPEPEFHESRAKLAAAEEAYATAYQALAQGIHSRAQARAQHHEALFPLVDTAAHKEDQEDLEYDSRLQHLVEDLARQDLTQQEKAAA